MAALIVLTFRECYRRAFPYVVAALVVALMGASRLFLGFSFGAGAKEATNLGISAVFLAGLIHAAFFGARVVRADLERGTLALILTKPTGLVRYLVGRFMGGLASGALLALAVAAAGSLILHWTRDRDVPPEAFSDLLVACSRGLLPLPILEAAALFLSATVAGFAAPIALIGIFCAGSIASGTMAAYLLPDFGLFGLEASSRPPVAWLALYSVLFSSVFLCVAYIFLFSRPPLRSQT